jgi:hypothetical protein
MSGIAREIWRSVVNSAGYGKELSPNVQSSLEVEATVGNGLSERVVKELESRLRRMFVERAEQLGLECDVAVSVTGSDTEDGRCEVLCNGRPVAVISADAHPEHQMQVISTNCEYALLRRLAVLLNDEQEKVIASALAALAADPRGNLYSEVPAYLLSNGVGLQGLGWAGRLPGVASCHSTAEIGEIILDRLVPTMMRVEVAESSLRAASDAASEALQSTRAHFLSRTGLEFPDVQLVPTSRPQGVCRFWFNDVALPEYELGHDADWTRVVESLEASLMRYAAWFVRTSDIAQTRMRTAAATPDLVDLSRSVHSDPLLSACVRSLISNGNSVANVPGPDVVIFPRLLWLLFDSAVASRHKNRVRITEGSSPDVRGSSPEALMFIERITSGIRSAMAKDAWPVGVLSYDPNLVVLPTELEDGLLGSGRSSALGQAELAVARYLASIKSVRTVAVLHPDSLVRVQQAVRCLLRVPRVIAAEELPPDASSTGLVGSGL